MTRFHVLGGDSRSPLAYPVHDRTSALSVLFPPQGRIDEALALGWAWHGADAPPDIVRTVDSIRVFSARVREVIDAHLGPHDHVQWLPCKLEVGGTSNSAGWAVPHFPDAFDALSDEFTTWGPSGLPIRWVLSVEKCRGHNVFVVPGVQDETIVTDEVLSALRTAGLTGLTCQPARTDR